MLLISLVAATVLLVAAVIFWRLSRRAEVMTNQLARDRQLKALGQMSAVLGHELRNPLARSRVTPSSWSSCWPRATRDAAAPRRCREALRMEKLRSSRSSSSPAPARSTRPPKTPPTWPGPRGAGRRRHRLTLAGGLPDRWSLDRDPYGAGAVQRDQATACRPHLPMRIVEVDSREGSKGGLRDTRCGTGGEGLLAGEEERIFEPFYTKRVRGTGLGSRRVQADRRGATAARWIGREPRRRRRLFRFWLPR